MKALRIAFFSCVLSVFFCFTAYADNSVTLAIPYLSSTTVTEQFSTKVSTNGMLFDSGSYGYIDVSNSWSSFSVMNYNGVNVGGANVQYNADFTVLSVSAEGCTVTRYGNRFFIKSENIDFGTDGVPVTVVYSVSAKWNRGVVPTTSDPIENCYLRGSCAVSVSNITMISDNMPNEWGNRNTINSINSKVDDILKLLDGINDMPPPDFLGPDAIVYFDARYFPNVNANSGTAYYSKNGDKYNDYFIHVENAKNYINIQNGQTGTGVFLSEGQYFFVYAADQYLANVSLAGWQGKYSITNKYFSKNAEFYFTVFEISVNEPMLVMNVQVGLDSNLNGILYGGVIPKSSDDTLGDSLNPNQNSKNNELNNEANTQSQQESQLWQNVNTYKSQLDFNLSGWNEATTGLGYVSNIFMLIWNNSPRQIITLSLMLGIGMLAIGRGVKAAVRQKDGDS